MSSGQILDVLVCASSDPGSGNGQVSGPIADAVCPPGESGYAVTSYLPYSTSQTTFDGLGLPFDPVVAAGLFSFGFGVLVMFWLLGLKGSVLLRLFWKH